jgi:hypothetical protein
MIDVDPGQLPNMLNASADVIVIQTGYTAFLGILAAQYVVRCIATLLQAAAL